jgi:hypothetical protein
LRLFELQFGSQHALLARGLDADSHAAFFDFEHRDGDVVTDSQLFSRFAAEH